MCSSFSCLHTHTHTVKLNGNRSVSGVLRGFDPYMNLVLDECVDERSATQKFKIGMVVSHYVSVNTIFIGHFAPV